jgi:aminoglycoside 3-N-acetyltransferase I
MDKIETVRLGAEDLAAVRALNQLFGEAFEDRETYDGRRPADGYLADLLARDHVIVLTAAVGGVLAGGLVAYELPKLEQARSEVYIYDLAVDVGYRRRGVATALIQRLQAISAERGAWVVFVQADPGDDRAIALYDRLGVREDVLHFDIPVR